MKYSLKPQASWAVAALALVLAALGVAGADIRWMVPLGKLLAHGHLPGALPFASAPTNGWHDAPALGELIVWAAYALLGERGFILLQALAVLGAWALLARGLRRQGSSEGAAALASLLALVGALQFVLVTRSYLFSLLLFSALVYLLEEDSRRSSRWLWLAVPLLALWSNLHGVALVGWAVLLGYLALTRLRRQPRETVLLGLAATVALCLTPVLLMTPAYYLQALGNQAAKQGFGLWAPLSLSSLDIILAVAALALLALAAKALRSQLRLWEALALAALALATVHSSRIGPWLLILAAYPAARALKLKAPRSRVTIAVTIALGAFAVAALARTPLDAGSRPLAKRAAASGQVVLADGLLAEQVELDGGRVWVGNPLDAFRANDQRLYLDWLRGRPTGQAAVAKAQLLLVAATSPSGRAAATNPRLKLLAHRGDYLLYAVLVR